MIVNVVIVAKATMGVHAIAGRGITPFLEMIMPIIQMMSIFVDLVVLAVIHAIAICKKLQLIGSRPFLFPFRPCCRPSKTGTPPALVLFATGIAGFFRDST